MLNCPSAPGKVSGSDAEANKQYYSAWYNKGNKSCGVGPEMNRLNEMSEWEALKICSLWKQFQFSWKQVYVRRFLLSFLFHTFSLAKS